MGALRHDGLTAPTMIDGAVNGPLFLAYVQQQLVPTLRPDMVIMDNLSSHKIAGVRKAIKAVGARVVYLPPYSPDFNPIAMLFAKLKYLVRSAAPRTVDALWDLLGRLVDAFPADECRHYPVCVKYNLQV
jgi:transposase